MTISRMVLGVDFTDASLAAARWAAVHFAPDAELVLAHVLEEPPMPAPLRAELPSSREIAAALAPQLTGGLRGLASLVGADRCRIATLVGDAAAALAALAQDVGADVVCVGRGRRRRGSARFGATLPARLAARSRIPTLVVPARRPAALSQVVAAVDHRADAGWILETACGLAAPAEARVDALHVIEPELRAFAAVARRLALRDEPLATDEWLQERTLAWVGSLVESVRAETCRTAPVIASGDAGQEIVRHAWQLDADLLVLGGGGGAEEASGAAGRRSLGSTARMVAWVAPCPVLVVPDSPPRDTLRPAHDREARGRRARMQLVRDGAPDPTPPPPAARHVTRLQDGAA